MEGIAAALAAIDESMRKLLGGGAPGTGLHYLLDQLAVTQFGATRSTVQPPAPAQPAPAEEAKPAEHEERGRRR